MFVRARLLALLVATLVGCQNGADAARSKVADSDPPEESSSGVRHYEGVGKDTTNGVIKNLNALGDGSSGNQELHIEKNDFIDVSWQRRHPELFRVKRKTATIALDVKDNTYRVWTHDYPVAAMAILPYGVGAVHPAAAYPTAVYPAEPGYSGYPVVVSGGAPVPLPALAHADYVGASPYYRGFYSPSYSLPYAPLPWASPYVGAGYLVPDAAASYLPGAPLFAAGYPDYPDVYSSLADLDWSGDYLQ
ncbi:uncharacterized protein [Dermacentor albipictus]|uniref:uncharacterized protein n=1 Tax=Dermacentor albipictus TaxID=60249 RepID=UPI0031FC3D51